MADVLSPRGVTERGTFHQWFSSGARAIRVLPTICVHMWSVSQVFSHSANGSGGHSDGFKDHLVDEAPAPVFARLHGRHDRMLGRMIVLGRMFVLGGITATDMAAGPA